MKGPGAAQPRNNAPFHSLSDTYTWSYMNDPPRLPQDLIWSASPLSPASAPTDVFIIALSRLCRRRAGRGARRHLAGESRGSPAPPGHGAGPEAMLAPSALPALPTGGFPREFEVFRGEAVALGRHGGRKRAWRRMGDEHDSSHEKSEEALPDTEAACPGTTTPRCSQGALAPQSHPAPRADGWTPWKDHIPMAKLGVPWGGLSCKRCFSSTDAGARRYFNLCCPRSNSG